MMKKSERIKTNKKPATFDLGSLGRWAFEEPDKTGDFVLVEKEKETRTVKKSFQQPKATFSYKVLNSDSLASIAAKFEVRINMLKKLNRLMSDMVYPGQTIYIPDKDYEFGGSSESGGSVPVSPVALTPPAIVSSTISHFFDVKDSSSSGTTALIDFGSLNEGADVKLMSVEARRIIGQQVDDTIPGVLLISTEEVSFKPDLLCFHNQPSTNESYFQIVDLNLLLKDILSISVASDIQHISRLSPDETPNCLELDDFVHLVPDKKPTNANFTSYGNMSGESASSSHVIQNASTKYSSGKHFHSFNSDSSTDECPIPGLIICEAIVHSPPQSFAPGKTADASEQLFASISLENDSRKSEINDKAVCECAVSGEHGNYVNSDKRNSLLDNFVLIKDKGYPNGKTSAPSVSWSTQGFSSDSKTSKSVLAAHTSIREREEQEIQNLNKIESDARRGSSLDHGDSYVFFSIKVKNPDIDHMFDSPDHFIFSVPANKADELKCFFMHHICKPESSLAENGFELINKPDGLYQSSLNYSSSAKGGKKNEELMGSYSKDWEVVNGTELRKMITIAEIDSLPLPEISEPSKILDNKLVKELCFHLPPRAEGCSWHLVYSTELHGFSLSTLYRRMAKVDSASLLIIKDGDDKVFGAMLPCALRISEYFYGSGESYLFTFYPSFKKFCWTGENNYFIRGNSKCLCIGSGEGCNGLWLDGDLYRGRTQPCLTYNNELLTLYEDFIVRCLEVWCFR